MTRKRDSKQFKIAASYDTETCNVLVDAANNKWRAYPVLYIVNDLRGVDIRTYEVGAGNVSFYRYGSEMQAVIDDYIAWGERNGCVPIICAYNLMFDLQPLMFDLNDRYDMVASAQSATSAYTVDIVQEGVVKLRFWDTFYLEMRGLAKMGETCGLPKATGDWDYSIIRTPETPLTDEELYYAGRDTEVIPAYLRYLLESNEWLKPEWLGVRVLTKTSLVRQAGKMETGRLRIPRGEGKPVSVQAAFERMCADELAPTYAQYALRKACFRGGFTFTSARYSGIVQRNVYSIDETSAHHAYINGHMTPVKFHGLVPAILQHMAESVVNTSLDTAMKHWEEPFGCAFHAQVRFTRLRLRADSAFAAWDIALLSEAKFKGCGQLGEWGSGDADRQTVTQVRSAGYVDVAAGARFAFGKLVEAQSCIVNVSEMELWCMSRVYEWDSMEVILGEGTCKFVKPPDYVTLLSNLFYARKDACKQILKTYETGRAYTEPIPESIPDGIAERIRTGEMERSDLEAYYGSTVKGMFNSIYGMEAQDVFKCAYKVSEGEISVDRDTVVTRENYEEHYKDARKKLVLYPYGLRIVGGSRMAIVAAIELVYRAFGERVRVLGGDTDSLKISCDSGVSADDLMAALEPFHRAVTASIDVCMERVRSNFPSYASPLTGVGTFEVEGDAYPLHMDAWNKARVSWDGHHAHITCAGLSRPANAYHIENWIDDMSARHGFEEVAPRVLGWGVRVSNKVCHALEHYRPAASDVFDAQVTDYTGKTARVISRESIALYPSDRVLGDSEKGGNSRTVAYVREKYGRELDTSQRVIDVADGSAVYTYTDEEGCDVEW